MMEEIEPQTLNFPQKFSRWYLCKRLIEFRATNTVLYASVASSLRSHHVTEWRRP